MKENNILLGQNVTNRRDIESGLIACAGNLMINVHWNSLVRQQVVWSSFPFHYVVNTVENISTQGTRLNNISYFNILNMNSKESGWVFLSRQDSYTQVSNMTDQNDVHLFFKEIKFKLTFLFRNYRNNMNEAINLNISANSSSTRSLRTQYFKTGKKYIKLRRGNYNFRNQEHKQRRQLEYINWSSFSIDLQQFHDYW